MSKKKSVIQKITQWKVIAIIQLIASLVLIAFLFRLGALPIQYAFGIIVLLLLLNLGTFFLMKPSKKNGRGNVRNVIGKIISLVLSVILLVGSLYIAQGNSVLNSITGANSQITRVSVVVKKDSKYEKLSDLKNQTVEVNLNVDSDKMKIALENLKEEESTLKIKELSDFDKMCDDLYDSKTQAVFVNEAYFAIFEAKQENFENDTKVIYTFEIEEEVKDISKNVDVTSNPFNIYISGIDTYGKVSTVSRSDVNMLVTVNPKTKQILMTSIPRDYYVSLPNKNNKKDKLTHAGLGGIENSVKTIEGFMDIDINYYARVNFTSLIKMVDALGGIDIESDRAFTAFDGSVFKKGINHVNGEKALAFSRERHAFADGDNERVYHQQLVLSAMIKKMMSPAIITNYSSVLNSIDGSFETNMESNDITSLIQMQINDMSSWKIVQQQLIGKGTMMTGGAYMPNNKLYYMLPNETSVKENKDAIQRILNGEKL